MKVDGVYPHAVLSELGSGPEFRVLHTVTVLAKAGVSEMVLDLEQTSYITSGGIRELILSQKLASPSFSLRLINVSPEVRRLIKAANLERLLGTDSNR